MAKPIPSHQVYTGTVFELVDHAVDFVLSKIALSVGTRAESIQAPVAYEIPKEVITEAIVNAVAHRDYTSGGSVQVMLFADRLEVWNPGRLPPPLTIERLRVPHESIPGNPLLARAMYLVKYIEQMGTGTLDMIRRCVDTGLQEPEFEAAGEFVTRIRRAAPAGQPVVFTDRADVERNSNATTQETRGTTQVTPDQAPSGRSDPACRSDQGRALGSPEVSACLVHGIVSNGAIPAGRCWSNAISSVASETCCAIRPTRSTRFVVPPTASTAFA